jgi:hypothetical protein
MPHSTTPKSVDETAVERNWPPKRVRKLIDEGLPTVKIGRQNFIFADTLDKFLKMREDAVASSSAHAENLEPSPHTGDGRA